MGKIRRRTVTAMATTLALLGTSVFAIWLSGISITSYVVSTNPQPDSVTYDLGTIDFDDNLSTTKLITYDNPNSPANVSFVLAEDVVSADPLCHYTAGVDFQVQLSQDGSTWEYLLDGTGTHVVTFELPSGESDLQVLYVANERICPLWGGVNITGNL